MVIFCHSKSQEKRRHWTEHMDKTTKFRICGHLGLPSASNTPAYEEQLTHRILQSMAQVSSNLKEELSNQPCMVVHACHP